MVLARFIVLSATLLTLPNVCPAVKGCSWTVAFASPAAAIVWPALDLKYAMCASQAIWLMLLANAQWNANCHVWAVIKVIQHCAPVAKKDQFSTKPQKCVRSISAAMPIITVLIVVKDSTIFWCNYQPEPLARYVPTSPTVSSVITSTLIDVRFVPKAISATPVDSANHVWAIASNAEPAPYAPNANPVTLLCKDTVKVCASNAKSHVKLALAPPIIAYLVPVEAASKDGPVEIAPNSCLLSPLMTTSRRLWPTSISSKEAASSILILTIRMTSSLTLFKVDRLLSLAQDRSATDRIFSRLLMHFHKE